MSKIQDAIRKLQIERPGRLSRPVHVAAAPIASVGLTETPAETPAETAVDLLSQSRTNIRRRVIINLDLLKRYGFLPPEDQQRRLADQYRLIKRPLLDNAAARQAHREPDANLILVTSALPGDGKTFNCINLSLSIAVEKDTTILLVDADVAKPHISNLFGLSKEPGLVDLLADQELCINDVVLPTDIPGLSILPAGRMNEHAAELFASRRMEAIVTALSESSPDRVVVFDSSPLLATSESRVLAGLVGQIVMIVGAGQTPQHAVLEALESLDKSKAINLVLNRASSSSGAEAYGHYGYGYGDGAPRN
jgi:exopolysaccharide/PEP-CTERM locus tyrosine autokinase